MDAAVTGHGGDVSRDSLVEPLVQPRVQLVDADDGGLAQQLDDQVDALPGGHARTCARAVRAELASKHSSKPLE